MRRKVWSVAALVVLSSGAALAIGIPRVQAADPVNMVEGPGDVTKTWKFEPASITITAGSSVVWHNSGEQTHTATGDSFDTGDVGAGKDSKPIPFPTAGSFDYICTPHPWMKGTIVVTGGGGATPSTAATTPTTQAGPATTATTGGATTTTTAPAAGGASTTTTGAASGATTTTTLAPGVTPTSAPEAAETTTTTAGSHGGGGEEAAAGDHASEGGQEKEEKKNSPIGIAFASVSTVLLVAIAAKMLGSKA
jgi:plastocyanin